MGKERALTLEAIRVLDAIDRRGSFAAAAEELGKVPSALSYTVQKLEDELDAVLFDRSGHRTKFTAAGRMLLERGRVLLEAAEHLVGETRALARGWETDITVAVDAVVAIPELYPLVERLAQHTDTRLRFRAEVLAGSWECLEDGRADLLISTLNPDLVMHGSKYQELFKEVMLYVAHPDHPLHNEPEPLADDTLRRYRAIAIADTALRKPALTYRLLDKQPRLTVSTMGEKRDALLAGLGIGTMPQRWVQEDIDAGRLRVISPEYRHQVTVILAWRRDVMGKAKSWLVREIPKLWNTPGGSKLK
ncbi:DNA-binding transcriptional regulator, LysR family [Aeromonas sp. RU39B]|uniref:LysR family transcriptional regulator n=1 Tax=Aeromonas sp. RU39B TaxID=1907416 RepID=UPI000954ECCF|nr:LysR family transcriptional regulator [Aeromonas sp. RU39B]SIR54199.1 DNA-binding transcriptional regulator, LysR family [Aeromonas sp. RU39B]